MTTCFVQDFVKRAVDVYRHVTKAPSVTAATASCLESGKSETKEVKITSYWSQRDLERKENRKFLRSHVISYKAASQTFHDVREDSFPVDLENLQLSSVSPSQKFQAILRKVPGSKREEDVKQFIEIWSSSQFIKSIDVQACEKHGKIYEDSQFGSLAWSSSEKYLLYVAEKKLPKSASYFERTNSDPSSVKPAPIQGNKFEFNDNWGEQLVTKCTPVLVVLDIASDEIKVLDGIPEHLSPGQAIWGPCDNTIVFVGWFHEPYRLGLIYCPTRKNALFSLSVNGANLEQLSDVNYALHSPRFNPTMDKMIYVNVDVGGAHFKCGRLMEYDWNTGAVTTVVDVVGVPERDGFPGIYNHLLTEHCWTSNGTSVILNTFWRSSSKIVLVNCEDKSITNLTKAPGSWCLLDVNGDFVLASYSSPNSSPELMIAALPPQTPKSGLSWTPVAQFSEYNFENVMTWEVIPFLPQEDSDFKDEYEAIFLKPTIEAGDKKPPLIVYPHGGPHVVFPAEFLLYSSCFCKLGFSVLHVNFRGSAGFGKESLHSLPGNVGTQDVNDVQRAVCQIVQSGEVDETNIFVMGGSHGGFLTGHLIGQYPDYYRAAVMRNPVLDIAGRMDGHNEYDYNLNKLPGASCSKHGMVEISDIPDWCFFELGGEFQFDVTATPELMAEMMKKSPMSLVSKVKTPTLILLGEEDRRVPPSQGRSFYKALKGRGVETRLLSYPGNDHPLNKVEAESDAFVNAARWFHEHLKTVE